MNDNLETTCVKLFRQRHTFRRASAMQEFGSQQIFERIAGRLLHQLSAHYSTVFGILSGRLTLSTYQFSFEQDEWPFVSIRGVVCYKSLSIMFWEPRDKQLLRALHSLLLSEDTHSTHSKTYPLEKNFKAHVLNVNLFGALEMSYFHRWIDLKEPSRDHPVQLPDLIALSLLPSETCIPYAT